MESQTANLNIFIDLLAVQFSKWHHFLQKLEVVNFCNFKVKCWKRKLIKDLEVSLKSGEVCKMESLLCISLYMLCIFIYFQCLNNFENKENSGKEQSFAVFLVFTAWSTLKKENSWKGVKSFSTKWWSVKSWTSLAAASAFYTNPSHSGDLAK